MTKEIPHAPSASRLSDGLYIPDHIKKEMEKAHELKLKTECASFTEINSAIDRYAEQHKIAYKLLSEWVRNV